MRAGGAETDFGGGTAVDANGYVQTAPLPANAQLSVRLTGMTATALTLTLPSGLPTAWTFATHLATSYLRGVLAGRTCVRSG